tara:strand:+ start:164 stop:466 length:303 start_codon:yes stop_codon:yes gene_type:complete
MVGTCYFCEEKPRVSYFNYYCKDCAMLRRWLLTYSPEKCCSILKRTLTRDDKQIDFKINQEIKKICLDELPTIKEEKEVDLKSSNELYNEKRTTRSNKKK